MLSRSSRSVCTEVRLLYINVVTDCYFNASFLVSTLLKTKSGTGGNKYLKRNSTTIYINPDNHYFAGYIG